jgi:hypothetical protein
MAQHFLTGGVAAGKSQVDPSILAAKINAALLSPRISDEALSRTPTLRALTANPGWPHCAKSEPIPGLRLPSSVSEESRLHLSFSRETLLHEPVLKEGVPVLKEPGDSGEKGVPLMGVPLIASAEGVQLITLTISATASDSGFWGCNDASDASAPGTDSRRPDEWPGWDPKDYRMSWSAYCQMPKPQSIGTKDAAARVHATLMQSTVREWLVAGEGKVTFADVLVLGCYGHRCMAALAALDWSALPPGSVRVLAFDGAIPTDACAVALYNYRLVTAFNSSAAFSTVIVPAMLQALKLFQSIHVQWRDVDRADPDGREYAQQLTHCELPARAESQSAEARIEDG